MVYVYIECNLILGGSSVHNDMSYLITVALLVCAEYNGRVDTLNG